MSEPLLYKTHTLHGGSWTLIKYLDPKNSIFKPEDADSKF